MRKITKALIFVVACYGLLAYGQDAPSLGEVARQTRQQKQDGEAKSTGAGDASAHRVITNEEIPEHPELAPGPGHHGGAEIAGHADSKGMKMSAGQWKSVIREQENRIRSQQATMEKMNDSVRFAPSYCVYHCVEWNERQRQKLEQVERMRAQLEEEQKRLEEMQETAREQGYGNSVYEP